MGFVVAALAARSLHSLSGRWAVLVPAGLVLVDSMTLPDPVLFVRERIVSLRALPRRMAPPTGALDLRLGARGGSTTMTLDRPTEMLQTRRGLGRGPLRARSQSCRLSAASGPATTAKKAMFRACQALSASMNRKGGT